MATYVGTDGADSFTGTNDDDTIEGRGGDDRLGGGAGADVIEGGTGNDVIEGGDGDDRLDGGEGRDILSYAERTSYVWVNLLLTDYQIIGERGGDLGGYELDRVLGFEDVIGSQFDDRIWGDNSDNSISGLGGNDILIGHSGNDELFGGPGADQLNGGAGDDIFRGSMTDLNGDLLVDFSRGDRIVFSDADLASFAFLLTGNLLNYGGYAVGLGAEFAGVLVASAAAGGGVQLSIEPRQDADGDFNGDNRSDLLLRSSNGEVFVWRGQPDGALVNAPEIQANSVDDRWKVVGLGDFNGNGRDDLLWRHVNGQISTWSGQIDQFTNTGSIANGVDNNWSIAGIADYNGDGRDDILWRHTSGEIVQWLGQPGGNFANNGGTAANVVDPSWTVVANGDFNGDGKADVLWQHRSGVYAAWQGSSTGKFDNIGAVMIGASGAVVGAGDFNGDGRDDTLMRNGTSGAITLWWGQSTGQFTSSFPVAQVGDLSWKVVAIGDFNGDGRDDLIWQHVSGEAAQWLATPAGDFAHNGALSTIPAGWIVQSPDIWLV